MAESRVVIVTGGGRGIGFGIAICFANKGDRLVLADVKADLAEASARTLVEEHGAADAIGIACDVTSEASVEALLATVLERFGRVDVLVNNAGICPFVEGLDMSLEVWNRTMDVNLNGAFLCTRIIGNQMIKQGQGGRIVCITSLAENVSNPNQVDYAASKAGLRMMAVSFSISLGRHGITVNCVAPGMILTDMTRHHWELPGPSEYIKDRVPVGRIGTPIDIGHAAAFLASPEAAYINGITLRVDGGFQARCV